MKDYSQAIREAARHYVYMENSCCFGVNELLAAHISKATTIADIFEKDYDWTEFKLRREENIQKGTLDEWFDEYCERIQGYD